MRVYFNAMQVCQEEAEYFHIGAHLNDEEIKRGPT